jgi:predicted enzyme related to lactoylglutathione lyase
VSAPTTTIAAVASVVVPINDHDLALAFYVERIGLQLRADFSVAAGFRWIEVAPPGAVTTIALAGPRGGMWGTVGGDTNVSLACTDIDREHQRLRDLGVDVDATVLRLGDNVPPIFRFRDLDGNVLQIIEKPHH